MKPKAVLGFDVDGTLTKRNTEIILPTSLPAVFNHLDELGYFTVLVTGKPSAYGLRIITKNGLENRGVIAENAGVYIKPGENTPQIFGPNLDAISKLKTLIGLSASAKGVTQVFLNGTKSEVVVDPEDVSILTIFTKAEPVEHKWKFRPGLTTEEVFSALAHIISSNNLSSQIKLLSPFPDGGIQVVRMKSDGESAIDKSSFPEVVSLMYQLDQAIPLAMFGDGHNDIPAMTPDSVTPLTFNNAETIVKDFVVKRKGHVSIFNAPEDKGVSDGLNWLLKATDFFKANSDEVEKILHGKFEN